MTLNVRTDVYCLDLFLVDAPLDIMTKHTDMYTKTRPTLRLTYSTDRGGPITPSAFPSNQVQSLRLTNEV